jgi:hypothetical protein
MASYLDQIPVRPRMEIPSTRISKPQAMALRSRQLDAWGSPESRKSAREFMPIGRVALGEQNLAVRKADVADASRRDMAYWASQADLAKRIIPAELGAESRVEAAGLGAGARVRGAELGAESRMASEAEKTRRAESVEGMRTERAKYIQEQRAASDLTLQDRQIKSDEAVAAAKIASTEGIEEAKLREQRITSGQADIKDYHVAIAKNVMSIAAIQKALEDDTIPEEDGNRDLASLFGANRKMLDEVDNIRKGISTQTPASLPPSTASAQAPGTDINGDGKYSKEEMAYDRIAKLLETEKNAGRRKIMEQDLKTLGDTLLGKTNKTK